MESTLVGLAISAVIPKLLELLKSKRWAPFIHHYSPWVNRTTAIALAFVTAIGVTVDFDATLGVLTVGGLLPEHMLRLGLTWILNFATQEAIYRRFFNTPSSSPPTARRGGLFLIPLLITAGLASGCASLGYRTGHTLVQAETAIHAAIGITVETGNRLCASKILDAPRCVRFNEKLLPVLKDAKAFNNAIQTNSSASIPAMVLALDRLADDVVALMPTAADRAAVIAKINDARALLRSFRGGK